MDLIFPTSAQKLGDFFVNVSDIYLPEVPVRTFTSLSWGDSDHTSFNIQGYKGVWPFEDINCDSPFIHHIPDGTGCENLCLGNIPCLGDLIGPSVNNPEQTKVFTQANLACVATLALYDQAMPPQAEPPINCIAEPYNNKSIRVKWNAPIDIKPKGYYIYRDSVKIRPDLTYTLSYTDKFIDYQEHCYTVTAYYGIFESDFSNESCTSIPNAINEFNSHLKIYPNPTTGELRISSSEFRVDNIEIFDVYGKKQNAECRVENEEWKINISNLSGGIYFLKIETEKGDVFKKVVKQ
jgi:hypothetical protein